MDGRVLTRAEQQKYLRFRDEAVLEHRNQVEESEMKGRELLLRRLEAQFSKYDINALRLNMHQDLMQTLKGVDQTAVSNEEQIDYIVEFIEKMIGQHREKMNAKKLHVVDMCFDSYAEVIATSEDADIRNLKK